MGDPKKLKKKYQTPAHPWNATAIEEGKKLTKEFGLGKKREILIANSFLKKYKNIAKKLTAQKTSQGEKEAEQILTKLKKLGILHEAGDLDQILALNVEDILNRRLQSVVYRAGLARTMKQARQFIVHRHIMVGDNEITAPSYLVSLDEQSKLTFKDKSALSNDEHPERAMPVKEEVSATEVTESEVKAKEKIKTEKKDEVKPKKEEVKTKKKIDELEDEAADIDLENDDVTVEITEEPDDESSDEKTVEETSDEDKK